MKKELMILIFAFLVFGMLMSFLILISADNNSDNASGNQTCIEREGQCCLGDICNSGSVTCVEGTEPEFKGCDENCIAILECENESETDFPVNDSDDDFPVNDSEDENETEQPICCHIFGYGANMEKVNSQYELMERDECAVPEAWVGGGREIVGKKRCEEGYPTRVQAATRARNILKLNVSQIPPGCTKTGSVIKCLLEGKDFMIVMAGKSGNTIIQVKGINVSTQVQLYHHNKEVYGIFKNNETRLIDLLPDELREMIRERTRARLNNTNITLNENGEYEYGAEKESRFLGLFKVREKVRWYIDSETGEILREIKPWWGFLAGDVEEEESEED